MSSYGSQKAGDAKQQKYVPTASLKRTFRGHKRALSKQHGRLGGTLGLTVASGHQVLMQQATPDAKLEDLPASLSWAHILIGQQASFLNSSQPLLFSGARILSLKRKSSLSSHP